MLACRRYEFRKYYEKIQYSWKISVNYENNLYIVSCTCFEFHTTMKITTKVGWSASSLVPVLADVNKPKAESSDFPSFMKQKKKTLAPGQV